MSCSFILGCVAFIWYLIQVSEASDSLRSLCNVISIRKAMSIYTNVNLLHKLLRLSEALETSIRCQMKATHPRMNEQLILFMINILFSLIWIICDILMVLSSTGPDHQLSVIKLGLNSWDSEVTIDNVNLTAVTLPQDCQ